MVNLSKFYELEVYSTEGEFIGQVKEVVLNIKKGRISFFKANKLVETNSTPGLTDVLRNSIGFNPEEDDAKKLKKQGVIDIPYDVVTAVGDIIIIDQEKLSQYHNVLKAQKDEKAKIPKRPQPKVSAPKN